MTTGTEPMARPLSGFAHALTGERLGPDGRYTLLRLIATGGMASVWVADDARTGREVAVKILSDALALDPAFVERFAQEARLAAGLDHPGVVTVLDRDDDGNRPYLVMEYVPGGTLADRIADGGLDRWDLDALARHLLVTLGYLHGVGVLHRDLKPANVLLCTDGRPRLTDFGVAQLTGAAGLTATGELIGTQRYLAPEVLQGHPATVRSDLYACGVLLAEAAGPDLSAPLSTLITRLTQTDPTRRPASASDALALLTPGVEPTAPIALSPELPTPAAPAPTLRVEFRPALQSRPAGPSRRVVALVAAGVLLATGAVVVSAGQEPASGPGPAQAGLAQELDALDRAIDDVGR